MPIELNSFTTPRLVISDPAATLADPAKRRDLYADLKPILSPATLQPLPPSMQLNNGPKGIANWVTARQAESKLMLVAAPDQQQTQKQTIGLLILADFLDASGHLTVHLGYLFSKGVWGRGYATEMLTGLVDWFYQNSPGTTLVGGVQVDNVASVKVLIKAGFQRDNDRSDSNTDFYAFKIGGA